MANQMAILQKDITDTVSKKNRSVDGRRAGIAGKLQMAERFKIGFLYAPKRQRT